MVAGTGEPAIEISAPDARRIVLAAQGFTTRRPAGRVDRRHFRRVLDQLGTVQLDSVNVLARSHELIFFSRLGTYPRAALTRWLWSSREVFEYWGHEASVHPVARYPYLRWRMDGDHAWGPVRRAAADNPDLVAAIRAAVRREGPLSTGDLDRLHGDGRNGASWWGWSTTKQAVEHLFWKGEVAVTRRDGFERVYLPPERWFPADVLEQPAPEPGEAQRALLLTAARACGLGTARDLADYFRLPVRDATVHLVHLAERGDLLPARVEGWRQPVYLHPEARRPRRRLGARALLSPFDSLIWERGRTERLWGFRYRIEIYVPAAKRVHGYYVLPFLLDETLVGRVDLKSDRRARVLRVRAAWREPEPPGGETDEGRVAGELAATLREMAEWLELEAGVEVEPRGDLAPALAATLTAPAPAP